MPRCLDTEFPNFSSSRLELIGGKHTSAHFTGSCPCRTVSNRRIPVTVLGLSHGILRFLVGFERNPASSMSLASSFLTVRPFFRWLRGLGIVLVAAWVLCSARPLEIFKVLAVSGLGNKKLFTISVPLQHFEHQ